MAKLGKKPSQCPDVIELLISNSFLTLFLFYYPLSLKAIPYETAQFFLFTSRFF